MKYAGGAKYEKRIYLDAQTDEQLRQIAQQLGFVVERGPTTGEGSPQALLTALCALGVDQVVSGLKQLLEPKP